MNDKVETADILGGVSMQKEDDHTSLAAADVNAFKEESSHEGQNAETDIDQSAEHRDNAEERHLEEKSSEEGNEAETEKLRLQDDSVLAKAEREGPVCVDDDVNNESKAAMDKNPDVDDRSEIESMEICKQSDSDLQLSSSPPSADILPSDTSVQHSESNVNKSSAFIKVESELPGNSDEATGMNSELKQMEASTTGTDRTDELERRLQEADELNSQLQAKAIGLQALYIRQARRSSQPVEGLQKADTSVLQRTKTALDEEESDKLVRYTASLKAWASIQATIKELQDTHPAKLSQIQARLSGAEQKLNGQREKFQTFIHKLLKSCGQSDDVQTEQRLAKQNKESEQVFLKACTLQSQLQGKLDDLDADAKEEAEKAGQASLMEYEQLRLEGQRLGEKHDEINLTLNHLKSALERNVHILAHIRMKTRSIQAEENVLKKRVQAVEDQTEQAQKQLLTAREKCIKIESTQKLTMKDFSRVTDPVLVQDFQRLMEQSKRSSVRDTAMDSMKSQKQSL